MMNKFLEKVFGSKKYNINSNISESEEITEHIWQIIEQSNLILISNNYLNAIATIKKGTSLLIDRHDSNLLSHRHYWRLKAFEANALEVEKDYQNAIDSYKQAIENSKIKYDIYGLNHQIAWCYMNLNNNEMAVHYYSIAIELKLSFKIINNAIDEEGMAYGVLLGKELKQMYVNRGNSLKNIKEYDKAKQDCFRAIEIDINCSNPYLQLWQIFDINNEPDVALNYLKKSISLGNNNAKNIYNQLKKLPEQKLSLLNFRFISDNHKRIENGIPTGINNKGAYRLIKIHSHDNRTFYITIFIIDENNLRSENNIQMTEKQMKIKIQNDELITLEGFGFDITGSSFSDYGLTLFITNNVVNKITLHMFDRQVDIIYEKFLS